MNFSKCAFDNKESIYCINVFIGMKICSMAGLDYQGE